MLDQPHIMARAQICKVQPRARLLEDQVIRERHESGDWLRLTLLSFADPVQIWPLPQIEPGEIEVKRKLSHRRVERWKSKSESAGASSVAQ